MISAIIKVKKLFSVFVMYALFENSSVKLHEATGILTIITHLNIQRIFEISDNI